MAPRVQADKRAVMSAVLDEWIDVMKTAGFTSVVTSGALIFSFYLSFFLCSFFLLVLCAYHVFIINFKERHHTNRYGFSLTFPLILLYSSLSMVRVRR